MSGRAEGLVDGKRRSVPFTLDEVGADGDVRRAAASGATRGSGRVLVTAMPEAKNGWSIQAVVNVGADGEIERVSVPRARVRRPRLLTDAEVERGLRDRAKARLSR